MKAYKFVRIGTTFITGEPHMDYKQLIINEAVQGWEFVQIFAPPVSHHGRSRFYELIFSKDSDAPERDSLFIDQHIQENYGIAQVTCPECGGAHDIDYPKCPYCNYNYYG